MTSKIALPWMFGPVLLAVLGMTPGCGGGGSDGNPRRVPSPWVATATSSAFEVTLFVTDQADAPFDSSSAPYPPPAAGPSAPRYAAYYDLENRTDQPQGFLVEENPYQRLQAFDAGDQPVWTLPDPTIPDAVIVTLDPHERVRFSRGFPDPLPVGHYRVVGSVFTPGPALVPNVELEFDAR